MKFIRIEVLQDFCMKDSRRMELQKKERKITGKFVVLFRPFKNI